MSSCGGGGGGGSTPTPTVPAPSVNFSANPTSVVVGSDSTLTWSSTNATSCSASGAWSGARATSGTETVTISAVGNSSFTITCSGEGGNRSATVTVEGYRQTDGVVVDGYISGADVFIDENANFVADATENSTISDNEGKFTIKYADGSLISLGGTDLDSQTLLDNLLITHKMTGHSDFKAITPVTSVAAFMQDASSLNAALGIDAAIDIFTFDPVANKGDGGINDYLYEKGNQLTVLAYALQNIVNDLNATTETTQDYFKAIAEEVDIEFANTATKVDIETATFITNVINNILTAKSITMDESIKANTITALAGVLPIIQVQSTDDLTTAIIRFSLSTLQNDIVGIANGSAAEELINSYTSDILNYIADDQNIDSDEITPDITAIADTATVEEDGSVTINVMANDSYTTTAPIGVSAGNGTNGSTTLAESSPEQVVYTPNADFNGTDTFTYAITQGDKTSSAEVTVTVSAVNDAPSIDIASTIQVPENQTAVTTVSVSDVDEDDLTLSLGGTDASSFNLSSENVLTFKEEPDYETKTSYGITLSLTDGTETVTKDLTISITNVNDVAPEFTSDATFSADENQTVIDTVTATDAEGDEVTFTVSGSELAITSAGVLTFVSAPDYETKTSYTATVSASDGVNTTTQDITVNVTDVNEAPVFTSNATFSADENQTAIDTVTATDAEGDDIVFTVSGSELAITSAGVLTFVSAPDFETKSVYIATVTASDGVNETTQDITININDVSMQLFVKTFTVSGSELFIYTVENIDTIQSIKALIEDSNGYEEGTQKLTYAGKVLEDNRSLNDYGILNEATLQLSFIPVFTSSATFSAAENQTAIDTVTATDANGDTVTFTVSGSELEITSAGVLTFASAPDFETKSSYTATVSASNGINVTTQAITVNVTNLNDNNPSFTSDATLSAAENQTSIDTVTATDADGDSVTFTISGSELAITSAGVLTFASAPDYETKNTYTATVTASDGTNSTTQDITVNVTNVNDIAPEFVTPDNFSILENRTFIATVLANDAEGDDLTFTVSGSDMTIIDGPGAEENGNWQGRLSFVSAPDYETQSSYSATLTVSDGTYSTTQDITVNVTDRNEAPAFTSNATFSAAENQTAIGTVAASDVDGDGITYSISGSDINIDASSGVISFASAPDYETTTSYTATVTASDNSVIFPGSLSSTQDITVNVLDVDDTPPVISVNGANPATVELGSTYTDAGATADGEETVTTSGTVDTDTVGTYTITYSATDASGNTGTATRTVNVVDTTAPVFTSSSELDAYENTINIGIGSDSGAAVTADDIQTVTFSISGTELTITAGGDLTFVNAPNYEVKSLYSATATATDASGNSSTLDLTITIYDVNEAPVIVSSSTFSAAENQTAIGDVVSLDVDAGDSITFSISGSELAITSASTLGSGAIGVLTFASAPDYETKSTYTATVTASDGTNSKTQDITVNVTDVNEAPSITSSASFTIEEGGNKSIGSITGSDPDSDTLSFSVSGSELTVNSSTGALAFVDFPDYETKSSYTETITVSDGALTDTQEITITVTDKYEGFNVTTSYTVTENDSLQLISTHLDNGFTVTYPQFQVLGGSASLSMTSSGLITGFDYEESGSSISIQTEATDGTFSFFPLINITINNINDNSPSFTSEATFSAAENQTAIGTVAASDADSDTITYSVSGTDSGSVSINSSTGVLTFNSAPNYESKTSYSIVVTASDGTNSTTQNITINITNVNEAPVFTSSASFSAAENQTTIGSFSVTDPENAAVSYNLSGTDASSLLSPSLWEISFVSAPNYESKNSYSATIVASDGTNSTTQDITISVTDVNDAPEATAAAYTMDLQPQSQTSGTLTLAGTDEDGDTLTYSIESNGSYGTASLNGTTVTYQTAADTQSAQTESFTFKVNDGTVDSSAATISISLKTDPLYQYQWHLNNTGQTNFATNAGTSGADLNVDTVIAGGTTGDGITVAVVDSGLELTHEDLADNIVANKSYDYNNSDNDPEPTGNDGDHGTSVAGIVAAVGWNNKGGRGVAPDASLVANNLINFNANATGYSDALGGDVSGYFDPTDVDIFNMSFGRGLNSSFSSPISATYEAGLLNGVTNLRSGKGAIYVNSAGNDWRELKDTNNDGIGDTYYYCGPNYGSGAFSDLFPCWDSSFDNVFATPYIIGVASLNANDGASIYSTPGSSVWVSGYGGEYGSTNPAIMTVDESSCSKGYVLASGAGSGNNNSFNDGSHSENSDCNYYSSFNGTSSAAPTVSGVVALMLEANPSLTWRDVKHILATTSTQVDASNSKSYLGVNQYSWITNAANYKHHNWYGFGKVNAAAAVSSAQSYTAGSLGTWVDSGLFESGTINAAFNSFTRTTMDGNYDIVATAPAGSSGVIEFVRIGIAMTHSSPEDVGIELVSPEGTTVPIKPAFARVTTNPNGTFFEIGVNSLYGESWAGNWQLIITDYTNDGVGGVLNAWDIIVYGR